MYQKKSVSEMIATEPYIKSKFRNKTYDGWKVIHIAIVDKWGDRWYYLRRHCTSDKGRKFEETITLTGKPMRDIYNGKRKIADVLKGKMVCGQKHRNHILQNTIMAKFTEE